MAKSKGLLYWCYGSNLNVGQMVRRCPDAKLIGKLELPKARLVFRGVADVVYDEEGACPGGLWLISPRDEEALDAYEGVSGGLYEKRYIRVSVRGGRGEACLVYTMLDGGVMPPSEHYLNVIAQGYRDFGLPLDYLDQAVARSWDDKDRTPLLTRRYERLGRPALARKIGEPLAGSGQQLRKRGQVSPKVRAAGGR